MVLFVILNEHRYRMIHPVNELFSCFIQQIKRIITFLNFAGYFDRELNRCRTDLIIFTEKSSSALIHLGCVVNHIRRDRTEPAQCRIIPYLRVSSRIINPLTKQQNSIHVD